MKNKNKLRELLKGAIYIDNDLYFKGTINTEKY